MRFLRRKIELAVEILEDKLRAYHGKIPRSRVTLLTNATYAVKRVLSPAREKKLTYVGEVEERQANQAFL